MLNHEQFCTYVIRPTLAGLELYSRAAEVLLLGTAITESRLSYIKQVGGGPAVGVYQMEPATYRDIHTNYLKFKGELRERVRDFSGRTPHDAPVLMGNMYYATAMARIHYLRVPIGLPKWDDAVGMAHYHKIHYNTMLGKTDPEESVAHFIRAIEVVKQIERDLS